MIAPALKFPGNLPADLTPDERERWRRTGVHRFRSAWIDLEIRYRLVEDGVQYDPEVLLHRHAAATLIIHGMCDDTVDWNDSLAFARQCVAPVDLFLVNDGDHRLTNHKELMFEILWAWLARRPTRARQGSMYDRPRAEGLQTRDEPTVTTAVPAAVASSGLMLLLLSLTYFLSYYDRLAMVVVGEMVKTEFALSDKQLSLLTGASFVVIYGICGIAAGWLVDHYSRKRVLIWSLFLWSFLTAACGMANSFIQLAIARAGVGIGEAANVPAAISAIADRYPPARRPMAVAIFYAGGMVGILACFLLGTWLATRFGWRAAFLVAGPPGVIVALLIAFAFPSRFAKHRAAARRSTLPGNRRFSSCGATDPCAGFSSPVPWRPLSVSAWSNGCRSFSCAATD
jgi:hypothetical protein